MRPQVKVRKGGAWEGIIERGREREEHGKTMHQREKKGAYKRG